MNTRATRIVLAVALSLLVADRAVAIDIKKVTFAQSLGSRKEPVKPGKEFAPDATIYLSVAVDGQPKTGVLACRFYYREQLVAEAKVDFAKQNKGLLFSFGSSTNVGFNLSHDDPFPVSSKFRAELLVNGKTVGKHPFKVVGPKGSTAAKLIAAELTKEVDNRFRPTDRTTEFLPRDEVLLSVVADVGVKSWFQGIWFIDGEVVGESIRSITFDENRENTGMAFSFIPKGGWPIGTHEVALIMNDDEVARKKFTIVKTTKDSTATKPVPRKMNTTATDENVADKVPENPKTAAEFSARGEHYYEQERYDDALADFNKAIRLDPKNAEYMSNRGWTYYSLEDSDTALVDFEDAIALDPTFAVAYRGRAQIHSDSEDWAAAIRDLSRAVRSAEEDRLAAEIYAERGRVKYFSGEVDQALKDFDRAVERDPTYAWAHANRGEVLSEEGEYEDAVAAFRKAIEVDDETLDFYDFLGATCENAGLFDEAIEAYTDALLVELDNVEWYHRRANAHELNGDLSKAVKDLRRAIKIDPENSDSYNNLAILYRNAEEYEAAVRELDAAIEVDAENPVLFYNRAEVFWQLDDVDSALADLKHSLKLNEDDAESYVLRGVIFEAIGEFDEAGRDYARAVDVNPDVYRLEKHRYLRIANSTGEEVTLYLQYFDGQWNPEDRTVATTFNIPADAELPLFQGDTQIAGSRFRVWAVGNESKKEYPAYRQDDFVASPDAGYATAEEGLESVTLTFPVEAPTTVPDSPGNTPEPSPAMTKRPPAEALPRSRTVHAVAFGGDGADSYGVCFPVQINVDKNPEESMDLAYLAGKSGPSWKAAGWAATCLAADILGHNPLSTQVSFAARGNIDGPSGGGLMTVGVLAALRSDPVRQDAAMTGTINPDGTIGTVGGIAQKMEGAVAQGKKMFLMPVGYRFGIDAKTSQKVDLLARGKKLGLDTQPVGDVYSAYKLLTGVSLPRPKPAAAPQLNPEMYSRVTKIVNKYVERSRTNESKFESLPSGYRPGEIHELFNEGRKRLPGIPRLLNDGLAPVAFDDAFNAAQSSAVAFTVASALKAIDQGGIAAGKRFVERLNAESKRVKAIAELKRIKPTTLSVASVLMQGYATLLQGMACQEIAAQLLAGKLRFMPADTATEQQLVNIIQACVFSQIAIVSYENMLDVIEIAGNVGGRPIPQDAPFFTTAVFLNQAAKANLMQFEAVVVLGHAEAKNVELETMKNIFMRIDKKYMITEFANKFALPKLFEELKGTDAYVYANLGCSLQLYVMAARLQAEYYSLKVARDDEGNATGVLSEASLNYMLDFSEDQVQRSIQVLRDHNVEPMASIFFCQMGSGLRSRGLEEQLGALTAYWQAAVQARTLAYLGGFSVQTEE